ncbi:MAG TPA: LL-diaminopimelate aminotransferase [bacterium]|nr:LL-diaminopimelate aminotransferase [bacterium]
MFTYSKRIDKIPPYLFAELDRKRAEVVSRGVDVINLSVGDPDLPTPAKIIETLRREAGNPDNHQYPSYQGMLSYREAVADWYKRRFDVDLDPKDEVLSLIGSKEGIAHIYLAFVQPGDISLVPSPAYPVYNIGTILADGTAFVMPILKKNGFIPDLDAIPQEALNKAKIMFLNYPNNPTGATTTIEFLRKAVQLAKKYNIALCHDCAYSELAYDGYVAPSILQVEGAKEIAVEFHSVSKTYCMTGWRCGWLVGNRDIVAGLAKVKTNVDSGLFQAIQYAAITALNEVVDEQLEIVDTFRQRRDVMVEGLRSIGWDVPSPKATFYLWLPVPEGYSSMDFCSRLLEEAGVSVTPGVGFGAEGEGYFRIAYTRKIERLKEAVDRISKLKF